MTNTDTILVVDDTRENLKLLVNILTEAGYRVCPANSGELALAAVEAELPALILLDVRMPGMDGFAVCRCLKDRQETRDIPVIFISASTEAEERVMGLQLGGVDFITKPFRKDELLARVQTHLVLRQAQRQLERQTTELLLANEQLLVKSEERKQVEIAMSVSELRYRRLFEAAKDGILILDADTGMVVDVNPSLIELLGYPHDIFLNKKVWELGFLKDVIASQDNFRALQANDYIRYEDLPLETATGRQIDVEFVGHVYQVNHHRVFQCNIRDITVHKQAEATQHASELRYRRLFEAAKDGILILDADTGVTVDVNPFLMELLGFTHAEFLGKKLWEIGLFTDILANEAAFVELQHQGYVRYENLPLETRDGRRIEVEFVSNVYLVNGLKVIQCNIRDITARALAEKRQAVITQILATLNRYNDVTRLVADVLHIIKEETGIETIGLRLRDGEDFPYFLTSGFPESCVEAERHLYARDAAGALLRDSDGNPVLECMCGNVLCGRVDSRLPFFTDAGSFWSNNTTALLASTTKEDRQVHMRNCCNGTGYESVALIPLHVGEQIIGLLQFNDHRPNQFTLERIHFFEQLGASIGIALHRQQMQAALKANEEQLRTVLDATPFPVALVDEDETSVALWSQSAHRLFGHTPSSLDEWYQLAYPDPVYRHEVIQRWKAALDTARQARQTVNTGEYWVTCQDGQVLICELYATFLPGKLLVTFNDITVRKTAEIALLESQSLFETVVESLPLMLFLKEAVDLRFVIFNRAGEELLGYDRTTLLGKNNLDMFPPEQAAFFLAKDRAVLDGDIGFEDIPEERIDTARQGQRWLHTRKIRILGTDGDTKYLLGISEDITEQKRLEVERIALEEQLHQQQRLETVGQLAAGVAHDFNNLLTGISGFTQFAYDDAPEGWALREELAEVLTLAKRAADLTHQLLAFSRRQPLQPVVLNVNDVIRESVKMLQRLLGEHLYLEVNLAAGLGMVKVDPGQFEQVLVNLAVNARDAMPDTGILTIESANVVLDETYAASHLGVQPGAYVMLAVSDSGIGIDAAVMDHIFEPFFTTKGVGKGTGLGLSTVYGIVKQHGGNIWVYSEPGQGTTVKVYLPRVLEDVNRDVVLVSTPSSSGTETILLVDDSDAVLQVTRRHLQSLGYAVFTATRPSEADAVLQAHGDVIDLLLTDVVMPEKNGRQLYEAAHARLPRLRVLYMSGYAEHAIVHDGVLDPGTPFMEKPFTIDTLAQKVREALTGWPDVC